MDAAVQDPAVSETSGYSITKGKAISLTRENKECNR